MAKFFVGLRVKVARPQAEGWFGNAKKHSGKVLIGDTGVVVGTESQPNKGFVFGLDCGISVHIDRLGVHGMAASYCFEPILPEGHQPVEMSKLLTEFPELEQVLGVSA